MTKHRIILGLVASAVFLSACSSPPKPPKIDMSAKNDYLNNSVYEQTPINRVPLNQGDHNGKPWTYQFLNLNRADYVDDSEKVRFFYFAQHADHIEIYGDSARTEAYKYWLQANGVNAVITTHYRTLPKNTVNITFKRG